MRKEWTNEEIDFLKDNYKTMTYREIGNVLDRTKASVDIKINKLGLKKSKYVYDSDFFNKIDTEQKAYWLGFIYADGCVKADPRGCGYEVCIKLQGRDIDHLRKFNKDIKGNIPVTSGIRTNDFGTHEYCQIRIYSKEMYEDLITWGAVENKTYLLEKLPNINPDLMIHFIRGFFDGDGCVTNDSIKRRTLGVNFTSVSYPFVVELRKTLQSLGINSYVINEKIREENRVQCYRLYVKGLRNVDNFLKLIYTDSNIYLSRKFNFKERKYKEYDVAQRLLL